MHIENLKLAQFKNFKECSISFSKDINCLVGENGSGKTNLLDAIYYLSATKSAFNSIDYLNIQHDEDFFSVIGIFNNTDRNTTVRCTLVKNEKKKVFQDKHQIEKASEHVGQFPVVLIAPSDGDLILGGSEVRRKFFDSLIAQFDRQYLDQLISYNHALKQRNELIKQFAEKNKVEYDFLEPFDELIISLSMAINSKRISFTQEFAPILLRHYQDLSENRETINLKYSSFVSNEDFAINFKNSLKKDLALQRTTMGVHRDDYLFEIDSYPLKKFGSQGQQKSFLIAIKLAQFEVLKEKKGFKPILLLDDIFDKLDDRRIEKLVKMINDHQFGQVFITDARPERTIHFTNDLDSEVKVIQVIKGTVADYEHI